MKFEIDSYKVKRKSSAFLIGLFRYLLLIGLCFIILFPFIAKISSAFMSSTDIIDPTVEFIPRHPTLSNIVYVFQNTSFFTALRNTVGISLLYAALTTMSCALVGYGLSKFRIRAAGFITMLVVFTILIPPQTIMLPIFSYFQFFNLYGLIPLLFGHAVKLNDTLIPIIFLAVTGFGFRAGLFTLIFRQFFNGVPDQLLEAASVDGSGVTRTFFKIVMPLSKPVLITVFLFSFCWQWTDTFYSGLLFNKIPVVTNTVLNLSSSLSASGITTYMSSIQVNTAVILAILPLILLFCIFQKGFVQGIERSGIVG